LAGIDALEFPERIGRTPRHLIKKLCKNTPNERLGAGKGGVEEIKKQKW
jgi:cGMP-dependent protein kinase